MAETIDITLPIPSDVSVALLVGPQDEYLHLIEDAFTAHIRFGVILFCSTGNPLRFNRLRRFFLI